MIRPLPFQTRPETYLRMNLVQIRPTDALAKQPGHQIKGLKEGKMTVKEARFSSSILQKPRK